jgi:anti-sigma B factor antagonist
MLDRPTARGGGAWREDDTPMPPQLKPRLLVRRAGNVTVVGFADRMLVNEDLIREVGDELHELVDVKQVDNLLLNFSDVRFMSSSLLGLLLPLMRALQGRGGQMKLSNLAPSLREVFTVSKLDRLFALYEDETAALNAF